MRGLGNRKAFEAAPRDAPAAPAGIPRGDARILDAAQRLFSNEGPGTSVDEIASLHRAGKPRHLLRFPSKETLFTAVVMRGLLASIERFESDAPTGSERRGRLESCRRTVLKGSGGRDYRSGPARYREARRLRLWRAGSIAWRANAERKS